MLPVEQSLKEMARDAMDVVDCRKVIRDAIDSPVLQMARQMRREEEERAHAFAQFADAGMAEAACLSAITSEVESAFRRSGAEEACAAITQQQKRMQLALPDQQLADHLTAALPQSLVDQQTMRMAKMAESLANDLTAAALQHAAVANQGANLAARLSESHWLQSLRNDYVSIVESYAANSAVAHWREIDRSVQNWPSTGAKPRTRPPRHRDEEKATSTTAPDQGGQHQISSESPNTKDHAALRHEMIVRSRPPVPLTHCYTLIGLVEGETRLFIANRLEERQIDVEGLCLLFKKVRPEAEDDFAERWTSRPGPEPRSVFDALGFSNLSEIGRLIKHRDSSVLFEMNELDRKRLGKLLCKMGERRNAVNHYRVVEDPDQALQVVKTLATEILRLIGLPSDVDTFLHDVRDTSDSHTLH